jgi:hypothetical protein
MIKLPSFLGGKKEPEPEEKYGEGPECPLCGKPGADKKFGGQYFHKKCLRKARKMAKSMF